MDKLLELLNQQSFISDKQLQSFPQDIITSLKRQGYPLVYHQSGYFLQKDIIDPSFIQNHTHPFYQHVYYFDCLDSTNEYMKNHRFEEGNIVIANYQTKGKGRNGRSFHSPQNKGIYLSLLLKPQISLYDSLKITACCSVALVKTIKKHYPLNPQIKWVNDIIIDDKKVAGILCEGQLKTNSTQLESMIVGVGINVHYYTMPSSLQEIATTLESHCFHYVKRQQLIVDFLNFFYDSYVTFSFIEDYRKYSYILHEHILVYENNQCYKAYVLNINDDASLTIEVNGKEKRLLSGEISIRKTNQK